MYVFVRLNVRINEQTKKKIVSYRFRKDPNRFAHGSQNCLLIACVIFHFQFGMQQLCVYFILVLLLFFFVLLHFANNDKYALNDNHGKWWPQFAQFTPDTNCAQIICGAQIEWNGKHENDKTNIFAFSPFTVHGIDHATNCRPKISCCSFRSVSLGCASFIWRKQKTMFIVCSVGAADTQTVRNA